MAEASLLRRPITIRVWVILTELQEKFPVYSLIEPMEVGTSVYRRFLVEASFRPLNDTPRTT